MPSFPPNNAIKKKKKKSQKLLQITLPPAYLNLSKNQNSPATPISGVWLVLLRLLISHGFLESAVPWTQWFYYSMWKRKKKKHPYGHFLTLHIRINYCSAKQLTCARAVVLFPCCAVPQPPDSPSSAVTTSRLCPARCTGASSNQDGQVPPRQPSSPERGLPVQPEQFIHWHKEMQAWVSWSLL